MDDSTKFERLARVRDLLEAVRHVPVATVNADGSPHLTPVFMAFDKYLNAYWASQSSSQHSQNITRDGRVFITVFDSIGPKGGGLYIRAAAQVIEHSDIEFDQAYQTMMARKEKLGGHMGKPSSYSAPAEQRLYRAAPQHIWLNLSKKDANGAITSDERHEIELADLLQFLLHAQERA